MRADQDDVCENACAAHGETRPPSSEGVSSPLLRNCTAFWGPLSLSLSLSNRVVNNLLGWDARKAVAVSRTAPSALRLTKKSYRKLQIRSHFTVTNMTGTVLRIIGAPRLIHSMSLPMSRNNASGVCVALRSRRLFLWIGGKLQQKPVQIRRDGFVMCLKCQLLWEAIPGLRSRSDGLNFQLFLSNRCDHKTIIAKLCRVQDRCRQGNQ